MIRAADLTASAPWMPTPSTAARRVDVREAAGWFEGWSAAAVQATICGELNPAARGLSVEQHASRVLMHLRDDSDRRA
jgi:hypothetical protein